MREIQLTDPVQLRAICNAAGHPIPDDEDLSAKADELVRQARDAWQLGHRDKTVKEVLSLAGELPGYPQKAAPVPTRSETVMAGSSSTRSILEDLAGLGLTGPPVPKEGPPPFPPDLAKLDDVVLRSLASQYTHYHSLALYRLGVTEADEIVAETLTEKARREAVVNLDKIDPTTKKQKLADVIRAEVDSVATVVKWKERSAYHEATTRVLRAERDIYQGYLDRISREMTARHNEWERSRS